MLNNSNKAITFDVIKYVPLKPAYCSFTTENILQLNNSFQKVDTGWTEVVTPVNISYLDGIFTTLESGVFQWNLERIYDNHDQNPSSPIELFIEVRKNGINVFERDIVIGSATGPAEPTTITFNSPFIFTVETNDYFEFYVKATEGDGSPSDTNLIRMQISANKIYNK